MASCYDVVEYQLMNSETGHFDREKIGSIDLPRSGGYRRRPTEIGELRRPQVGD